MQQVPCDGAPRDLGLDQGRACREAVRAELRALGWSARDGWLAAWRERAGVRPAPGLARDLARHFPHLDERVTGLAAGAGVPREALLALLAEELDERRVLGAGIDRTGEGHVVALALRAPLPATGLVVRRVRPDGGLRNLTLTRPGLVAALAGVNEGGLAGAVVPLAPAGARDAGCGAPGALLLEQCLERLDGVDKALEWCGRRPGGGRARLLFADAGGAAGALDLDGDTRTRREAPALEPFAGDLVALRARLDPRDRSLVLERPGAPAERLALDEAPGPAR